MTTVSEPLFAITHHLDKVQQLVRESFAGFFRRECPSDRVRAADATGGFDAALWSAFTKLGGQAAGLPEDLGGAGGSLIEAVLIAMECGRRLAPLPYAESACAAGLRARTSSAPVDLDALRTVLDTRESGAAHGLVSGGQAAEFLIVRDGVIEVYRRENPALRVTPVANLGGLPLAELDCRDARPDRTVEVREAELDRWLREYRLLAAAVLVGAGQQALAMCLKQVKERRQFGRPIGAFQAVQHRLADRVTDLAAAQLLLLCDPEDGRHHSAVTLVAAAEGAESAAKEALQLFGGYGYTLEYDIHLYLRFVKAYGVVTRDHLVARDIAGAEARS
jgi:alkylation response protein AidB-like acyl-CoA dehydrogenase